MFDYVIIGAGSAGCVLANRLSEDGTKQVLLLEAGGKDNSLFIHSPVGVGEVIKSDKFNWCFDTAPQTQLDDRELFWPRGKVLGGSSSINGMVYIRGVEDDYNQWSQLGNRGWSYADVLPYFKKSQHQERGENDYHGVDGHLNVCDINSGSPLSKAFLEAGEELGLPYNHDFNSEDQEGVGPIQATIKNGKRCSAAAGYLKAAQARPNLHIETHAHITKLQLEGRRVCGVEYQQKGKTKQVTANKEVILSAGAVQSPQILLLSGIGSADQLAPYGIAQSHDLPGVGYNLQDHLDLCIQYNCTQPVSLMRLFSPIPAIGAFFKYITGNGGPLAEPPIEVGAFIKSIPQLDIPDIQLHFLPTFMIDHGRTLKKEHGMTMHMCQLRPESRGHIGLQSADPLAPPMIQPNYLDSDYDMEVMVKGVKACRQLFQTEAFAPFLGEEFSPGGAVQTDQEIKQYIRKQAETIYHPVGTCKMGSDDMAVVDDQLKVHGLEGLRVVDASIMPTLVGGNTNAPTIMIAEKAADLIKASA